MRRGLVLAAIVMVAVGVSAQSEKRSVLIKTAKPYDKVVTAIETAGGTVTRQFKYIDGLAADIPDTALPQIERMVGRDNIGRDDIIPLPETADPKGGVLEAVAEGEVTLPLESGTPDPSAPSAYTINNVHTKVAEVHALGHAGAGAVIAVIDSGYRPVMQHVSPSRLIAPGLNLVPGATEPPAISDLNVTHGTFVAGMAAANRGFCFSPANRFVVVAQFYGVAVVSPLCPAGTLLIPMVGSAPAASIFPIKVFPASGAGAPSSRTIAAMEAAIDLRQKYDAGDPAGLNIQVANLSLGGPTSAAARTLSDLAVEALINNDIVPAIAMGNDGFSSVTGGSPATSFAALTVGAASGAEHEHIFRAQFSLPCSTAPLASVLACALAWRPDIAVQVSEFSSRGPSHDGRVDPDIVAYGSNNFSQGSGGVGTVNFGSGTSFATPTVAGIAAVLAQAVPSATAKQIRNALISSADGARIPTATPNDQGAGFVNAKAALDLLQTGTVPDQYSTAPFTRNLQANMDRAGRPVFDGAVSMPFTGIRPAEVPEVPILVHADTLALNVRIHSIVAELPDAEQNPFFGDDVFLRIQSSAVHRRDRRVQTFLPEGATPLFTFARPEEGVWRITPTGDWTNAGKISFTVDVWTDPELWPDHSVKGKINFGELQTFKFAVPAGTTSLQTRLSWLNMNGSYPISDIDVILTPPSGPVVNTCNTIRAPELCTVTNPLAGTWTATVVGFSVPTFGTPGGRESFTLRIAANGIVLLPQ